MNERLRASLLEQGGLLAELAERPAADDAPAPPGPPQRAASGPRAAGREADYELLLEIILQGSRLHYEGSGELDPDLALLLGDQLYALGLERLAGLGDLEAVSELGDLISLVAQAHAASDPQLAAAIWAAGAVAIGWGSSDRHEAAKALARAEDPSATERLRGIAEGVAS